MPRSPLALRWQSHPWPIRWAREACSPGFIHRDVHFRWGLIFGYLLGKNLTQRLDPDGLIIVAALESFLAAATKAEAERVAA